MAGVTFNRKYLYPSDFVEGTTVMSRNQRRIVVNISGLGTDTSDQADIQVIDKSDLIGPQGAEPSRLEITRMGWDVQGFTAVILEWDDDTDELIARLTGSNDVVYPEPIRYSGTTDTGDILVTTIGGTINDTYNITIWAKLIQ